jgi:hypothetical protein
MGLVNLITTLMRILLLVDGRQVKDFEQDVDTILDLESIISCKPKVASLVFH